MKLAALLQHLGQAEVAVERQRQRMARLVDFEPYASFQRVDRECLGYLNCRQICQYLRENGYRELEKEDVAYTIRYFDSDGDMKLAFHE
jgi:hypothetical protein